MRLKVFKSLKISSGLTDGVVTICCKIDFHPCLILLPIGVLEWESLGWWRMGEDIGTLVLKWIVMIRRLGKWKTVLCTFISPLYRDLKTGWFGRG